MIVAGIGCRRGTLSEDIVSLIHTVLAGFGIARDKLDAIATETSKADESGIEDAARCLSVRLVRCSIADLERVADKVMTRSSRVQALKGVPSIAEAVGPRRGGPQCPAARRAGRGRQSNLRHRHR